MELDLGESRSYKKEIGAHFAKFVSISNRSVSFRMMPSIKQISYYQLLKIQQSSMRLTDCRLQHFVFCNASQNWNTCKIASLK